MVDWQLFTEYILPEKNDYTSKLVHIDSKNQMGLFFKKQSSVLYFGFIQSTSEENLLALINQAVDFAKTSEFTKLIGPIDGATWSNYRFQYVNDLGISYPGQPTYSRRECDVFIKAGFYISELYESVQIANISKFMQDLNSFKKLPTADLTFVQPTKDFLLERADQLHDVLNEVFQENAEYSQISKIESQIVLKSLLKVINFELSVVALNSKNQIVGFMMNYLIGETLYFKTIGFVKAHRNQGLSVFKIVEFLFANVLSKNQIKISNIIICLMKKDNFPSLITKYLGHKKNEYVLLEKII